MNQNHFYWSTLSQLLTPVDFINVSPSALTFTYESGLTDILQISGTTGYTVTTGASWFTTNVNGGVSGVTYVTVRMESINSGTTDRSGTLTIQSLDLSIVKYVTITQMFEPQPFLFIMTEGGTFEGILI